LEYFKDNYRTLVLEHPELGPKQVSDFYKKPKDTEGLRMNSSKNQPVITVDAYRDSVEKFLQVVIIREKAKPGCNFEIYKKLLAKSRKAIRGFSALSFKSLDFNACMSIASAFAEYRGYKYTAKAFRGLLGKASKDQDVLFNISQIGDFHFSEYNPNKYDLDIKRPDVLTQGQLKAFLNLDFSAFPTYKTGHVELYYNFCVFMFHSFLAPCDVLKLKYKDITNRNTLILRRKKTHKQVEIPLSQIMANIVDRYRGQTKNDYVFPIMDDEKEKKCVTKDYILKNFRSNLNIWLKLVGKELGLDYKLYAYVFRHTAITVALDNGLPIAYIAAVAGTSIEMIQKHYYNGDNQQNQQRLQMAFMEAAL
jgi:integrase